MLPQGQCKRRPVELPFLLLSPVEPEFVSGRVTGEPSHPRRRRREESQILSTIFETIRDSSPRLPHPRQSLTQYATRLIVTSGFVSFFSKFVEEVEKVLLL